MGAARGAGELLTYHTSVRVCLFLNIVLQMLVFSLEKCETAMVGPVERPWKKEKHLVSGVMGLIQGFLKISA